MSERWNSSDTANETAYCLWVPGHWTRSKHAAVKETMLLKGSLNHALATHATHSCVKNGLSIPYGVKMKVKASFMSSVYKRFIKQNIEYVTTH